MAQWMDPRAYNQAQMDLQSIALNNQTLQMDQVKLQEAKIQLSQNEKTLAAMANLGPPPTGGGTEDTATYLTKMAGIEIASGKYESGAAALDHAEQLRHTDQLITASKNKQTKADLDTVTNILNDVPDSAQGWEEAKTAARMKGLDKDPVVKKVLDTPYYPATVDKPSLIGGLLSGSKSTIQALNEEEKLMKIENEASEMKSREIRDKEVKARTQTDILRAAKLKQEGATGFEPKSAEISDALNLVSEYYDTTQPSDLAYAKRIARDIAGRAKQLQKDSRLTVQQANNQAFKELKDTIMLSPASRGGGTTKKDAVTLPKDITKRPAGMSLEDGMKKYASPGTWYQFPNGTFLWDGSHLLRRAPASVAAGDDDDEGEED